MPRGAVKAELGGASIAFLDYAPGTRPVNALLEVGTRVLPSNAGPSGSSEGSEGQKGEENGSGGHFGENPSIQLFPLNAKFLEVTDKSPQGPRHSFPAVWPLKAAPKNLPGALQPVRRLLGTEDFPMARQCWRTTVSCGSFRPPSPKSSTMSTLPSFCLKPVAAAITRTVFRSFGLRPCAW